jgi:hypothetical protein
MIRVMVHSRWYVENFMGGDRNMVPLIKIAYVHGVFHGLQNYLNPIIPFEKTTNFKLWECGEYKVGAISHFDPCPFRVGANLEKAHAFAMHYARQAVITWINDQSGFHHSADDENQHRQMRAACTFLIGDHING